MSKELEALDRMFRNVDPREEYCTFDNDMEDYNLLKSALERKEQLEKAFHTLSKENEKIMKELSKEIEKNRILEIIKKYAYEINFSIENEDTKKVEDWLFDDK